MAIRLILVALAYFVCGWLGLQMPYVGQNITLLWFPTGVAVAAFFRWGSPVWPGIVVAAFFVNLSVGSAWPTAAGIALGNTLGPLLTAQWLKWRGFHAAFDRQRDVGHFTVAVATGMLVSASGGVACLYGVGVLPIESVGAAWLSWWMGDTVGALLAGSLLLSLTRKALVQFSSDRRALMLWLVFAIPVAWFAFVHDYVQIGRSLPLAFLTLPLFAWAALRFGVIGAALAGMAFSTVAAWSTATGHGTFALPNPQVSLLLLWTYMASTVLTGLLITAMQAERLQAQSTLRESQQNLAITLDSIGDAVIATDTTGRITNMNPSAERLTAWPRSDALGRPLTEVFRIINAQTRLPSINPVQLVMERGEVVGLANHTALLARDGCEYQIADSAAPIRDATGIIVGVVLVFSDVTEKYAIQQALQRRKNMMERTENMVHLASFEWDIDANSVTWSPEMFHIFGRDPALGIPNLQGQIELYTPQSAQMLFDAVGKAVSDGTPYELELMTLQPDGEQRPCFVKGFPERDDNGRVVRVAGLVQDISVRKKADMELRQSEQKFSTAFSSCPVAASIATADDGSFIEVNENYERDFGWTRADLIGKTSVEVGVWPDGATRDTWVEAIRREGRLVNYETVWMHKNGERRHVSLSAEVTELNGRSCILAYATDISARKRADQILAASEIRLRSVLNGVQSGVVVIAEDGVVESFNQSAQQMFGYRAEEVIGHNVNMLMPEPYQSAHDGYLADYLRSSIQKVIGQRRDIVARRKDGSSFPIELGVTETLINGTRFFIGSISDISFRRAAEAELRIAATAFESQEGMMVTDPDGVILRVNKAFTASCGYTAEEAVGQTPRLLKSGRHDASFYLAMWETIKATGGWQGEIWDRRKDGTEYPKWLTISAVVGDDGVVTHYVGTHQDITERKAAEERINELAFFDPLTRLPNRTLLLDRLRQAMTAGARNASYGSLLFIDLDNFKTLNDTLGHDIGDLLLQRVAQRLSASVREGDTVARLGGDEFVVVLESLSEHPEEAATQTEAVGGKVLAALNGTYLLNATEYRSSASIGATLFKGHLASIDDLMKQADLAMYKSKQTGRNALHFFDPAMQTLLIERAALEASLRTALEDHQFVLHYQPQVVDAGRVTGAEVLVRWQHPERGLVSPNNFIPLAEETGLILPLGQWVLETACAQLALWDSQPEMAHLTVAVNVSAREFGEHDYVSKVFAILSRTGVDPKKLKLELTESLLVSNIEDVIEKMFALKAKGVGFSLDDFGTGYSSLSYLKRLPLDQLKIDQSFVRDVLVDPNDAAIARTVVALAQNLGLGVIAEGVETDAQRVFLAGSGCHAYQGYLFSRPLPVDAFEVFVRGR